MKFSLLLCQLIFCLSCNQSKAPQERNFQDETQSSATSEISLTLDWIVEGLDHVESVLYDPEKNVVYATNGKDNLTGKDGYISLLDVTGKLMEKEWVKDLIRPTGMAIHKNKLYTADVNRLLVIDKDTGKILQVISEPVQRSGLYDVTVTEWGDVFVTASFIHAVLKLADDKLEIFVQDTEHLEWANGILAEENNLLVCGEKLTSIDIRTKEYVPVSLNPPINDFDGITKYKTGAYFLTTVENSALWYANENLFLTELLRDDNYTADLQFIPDLNRVLVARGNTKTNRYYVAAYSLKPGD